MTRANLHNTWLKIKTSLLVSSIFSGDFPTKIRWKWVEFERYTPYQLWDDASSIDFSKSATFGTLQQKTYTEERQLDVYVLSDVTQQQDIKIGWVSKHDFIKEIVALIGYSTIQWWNRFWLSLLDREIYLPPKWQIRDIEYILQVFDNILNNRKISEKKLKKHHPKLQKKLIFYLTSTDTDIWYIQTLSRENDVIVLHTFHSFENTLNGTWLIQLSQNEKKITIDLDDTKKKKQYQKLRQKHIHSFRSQVLKTGAKYTYIDTSGNIYTTLSQIFYRPQHA